jgi:hypothetical protein
MKQPPYLWKFIAGILGLLAVIFLIRDFNSRMADLRRLAAEKEKVSVQVTSLVSTKQALETQVAYSMTDDAVRKYAYESADMQQPDDHLVIPVGVPGENPESTPAAAPAAEPVQNWQLWMALFVDSKVTASTAK